MDYINIIKLEDRNKAFSLIYYGDDFISSQRYVKASGILEYFDKYHFLNRDSVDLFLENVFYGLGDNFLFHYKLKDQSLSHVFLLPTGVTTAINAKQIALDAINVS